MSQITKRYASNHTSKKHKTLIKIGDLKSLKKIRDNVAGIDVGSDSHFVATPDPQYDGKIVVHRFGSFTSDLRACVSLLIKCKIESIAMEATGVYWTTLYQMLTAAKIEVVLVNAHDFKKIKDKKTDVCDAEYLQLYHSYGLLEGAFIPEQKINELRTFLRLREQHVKDAATGIQRMQKACIKMNLRLDNVLSDISGVTGMSIIQAILNGERDPKTLAQYRDKRCRKTLEEIEESLNGFYQEDQLFALRQALSQYEFFLTQVAECDKEIQRKLDEFESVQNANQLKQNEEPIYSGKRGRPRKLKSFEFSFDLKTELIRITGVDLTRLAGIGPSTALTLISETGLDMTRWKSSKHFSSWLKVAANNKISGGKVLKRHSRPGKNRAALALRMSVSGLYRDANETALGAFFRIKRAQLGAPKAITAGANKLARMYYNTMLTKKEFEEPGAAAYLETQKARYLRRVKRTISPWGYEVKIKEEIINKIA